MNEHVSKNYPPPDLPEPHFDEEATLLSARRVVPLTKVRDKSGKRWLLLALIVVLAGALGSATALLLYSGRSGSADEALVIEDQPVESPIEVEATPEPTPQVIAVSDEPESEPDSSPEQIATETVKEKPRVEIKPRREPIEPSDEEDRGRREDQSWEERRRRRVEENREERRQQRRARREERRQQRRAMEGPAEYPDEIFRIREIFEGSPRPD